MARDATNRAVISDFPGQMDNVDPQDIPPGAAELQLNLTSKTIGAMKTRRGYRIAAFDGVTTIASLAAD